MLMMSADVESPSSLDSGKDLSFCLDLPEVLLWRKKTDLQVLLEVVEQNHLQHQLLSPGNAGRKVEGQEEVLKHRELQGDQRRSEQQKAGSEDGGFIKCSLSMFIWILQVQIKSRPCFPSSCSFNQLINLQCGARDADGWNGSLCRPFTFWTWIIHLYWDLQHTSAGFSVTPRPRSWDMTKAEAVQVVMLSGTVSEISSPTEALQRDVQMWPKRI